jgi:hypothetical protein
LIPQVSQNRNYSNCTTTEPAEGFFFGPPSEALAARQIR